MDINDRSVPPGFRFHPTEEELVGYYLMRKISSLAIDLDVIIDIDLYRIEPWDIQDKCKLGYAEQTEWYFFSHKDKKYPTGTRTNRATAAGFWKATGRDKAVVSKNNIIGMRKTLVYYKGRAPNGRKSDWIMHEYRLQTSQHALPQEEGWVVCRAFKKPIPSCNNRPFAYDPCWQIMNPRSTTTTTTITATPLPDLIDSNYNTFQQPLPTVFDFDHQQLQMSSDNCTLANNYDQQGTFETNIHQDRDHEGSLYEDYKGNNNNWNVLNSLLGCDNQIPEQMQSTCAIINVDASSYNNNNGYDQLSAADQDEQVGHYLTCFNNM